MSGSGQRRERATPSGGDGWAYVVGCLIPANRCSVWVDSGFPPCYCHGSGVVDDSGQVTGSLGADRSMTMEIKALTGVLQASLLEGLVS